MARQLALTGICLLVILAGSAWRTQAQIPYRITDKEVEKMMQRLKRDSDKYKKSLDSALDKSSLDGTNREDDINSFVKDFYKETDTLYNRFKDHKSIAGDVQTVLDRASRIDGFMRRHEFRNNKPERDWGVVRGDLSQLAEAYNVTWNWGT
jgi:hypothetical protein